MKKSILTAGQFFSIILLLTGAIIHPGLSEKTVIFDDYNQYHISIDSALKIASIKLFELEKSDKFYIIGCKEIYVNDKDALFYIFDLDPQGFIVVSGDSRLPPVLFYSFTSRMISDNLDNNILLNIIELDVAYRLKNIEYLPSGIIDQRQKQWDILLTEKQINLLNADFEQWPPEGVTETGGWVETQWHQKSPFNNFCPMDGDDRSVAGCPSIAMAQIINYHKNTHGTRFNDNDDYYHNYGNYFMIDDDYEQYDFLSFPELNNYLITLDSHYENDITLSNDDKACLTFACGVAAKQVYTADVSGTFGVNQAYDAYLKFGCNNIELFDEENPKLYERLIDNMKNAFPAHLALVTPDWNTGHNMVLDGYNTDDFYHINFGFGGTYDGWYLLPDEEMPYGLTVIEGVIFDIMIDNNMSNLECDGILTWNNITAGSTLLGCFEVKNIGRPGSELDWEIESYPSWGSWNFSDTYGENLKPEDGPYTVEVSVVVPNEKNKNLEGGINIVNKEADGDVDYIPVVLFISKNKTLSEGLFLRFLEKYQILYHLIQRLQNL